MERLTKYAPNGLAYLAKVKENEQAVDSKYPNTLKAILESFQALAAYEDLNHTPEELASMITELERYRAKGKVEELERVVHCGECRFNGECVMTVDLDFPKSGHCNIGERREKE